LSGKQVSLVLGSGGARGLAHIGAIRCLEELGYEIRYVSGSSMGALIGGIYAAGKLDVYADWVCALERKDIVQLLDFGWGRGGALFKGERIITVLKDLVGEWQIEDLPMGYTAVATELNRKREVWFNKGPLFFGIRASIAVPMVFTPVKRGKQVLLDGGILNPLPIAPTLNDATDLIVAVDVNGMDEFPLAPAPPRSGAEAAEAEAPEERNDGIRRAITDFIENLWPAGDTPAEDRSMFDIALEAMDAMQVTISRQKLAAYSPDVLVQIPRNTAHFFEFERAGELIDLGYERMAQVLRNMDPDARDESS